MATGLYKVQLVSLCCCKQYTALLNHIRVNLLEEHTIFKPQVLKVVKEVQLELIYRLILMGECGLVLS